MSTRCKLNPVVRSDRAERAAERRFFRKAANVSTPVGKACLEAADILDALKVDPKRTGAQKHCIYERVAKEVYALASAAEMERQANAA